MWAKFKSNPAILVYACSIAVFSFPQETQVPDEFAACKGASPFIVQAFHEEDSLEGQMFVMADKTTFLELGSPDATTAVLLLMALFYSFNLEYPKGQHLMFMFLEEYVLGIIPPRKSLKYRKYVANIFRVAT